MALIEVLKTYHDLCQEIEFFDTVLKETQREWAINRNLMFRNPTPSHNGGFVPMPMERVAENMDKIMERHNKVESMLNAKKKLKKQVEDAISDFEGIDYKVAYKRFIEGKKLEVIAEELNYSIDGIKKISSRITKATSASGSRHK